MSWVALLTTTNASRLAPINMIRQPELRSIRFRVLAEKLFSLKKTSSDVADQATTIMNQYNELMNLVNYEKKNEFCNFDSKKDRLDVFFSKYLISDSYKD